MLLERGIVVSYETIRRWGWKFGPAYAKQIRRRRPSHRDVWHLDEAVVSIAGRKHWLWRAVDQDGYVLDEIVQSRRDTRAARRLLVRLFKKAGMPPKQIITDKLRSYGAAKHEVNPFAGKEADVAKTVHNARAGIIVMFIMIWPYFLIVVGALIGHLAVRDLRRYWTDTV